MSNGVKVCVCVCTVSALGSCLAVGGAAAAAVGVAAGGVASCRSAAGEQEGRELVAATKWL